MNDIRCLLWHKWEITKVCRSSESHICARCAKRRVVKKKINFPARKMF